MCCKLNLFVNKSKKELKSFWIINILQLFNEDIFSWRCSFCMNNPSRRAGIQNRRQGCVYLIFIVGFSLEFSTWSHQVNIVCLSLLIIILIIQFPRCYKSDFFFYIYVCIFNFNFYSNYTYRVTKGNWIIFFSTNVSLSVRGLELFV